MYEKTNAELVLTILKRQVVETRPDGRLVPQPRWIKYGSRVLLSIIEESGTGSLGDSRRRFSAIAGDRRAREGAAMPRPRAGREGAARVRLRVRRRDEGAAQNAA